MLLSVAGPRVAEARWRQTAAVNIQENWELIRQAAWFAGIEDHAPVLAAITAHETHLTPMRGRYHSDVWGPGQVSWMSWGSMLRKMGIADHPEDLVLDMYTGLLSAAVVLARLRADYPDRSLDLVLCMYGCGPVALGYTRDCQYSRAVMANLSRVHRAVWARAEQVSVAMAG